MSTLGYFSEGPFGGVLPTHRAIVMHGMSIHRIVENWHVADKIALLRQIGAIQ